MMVAGQMMLGIVVALVYLSTSPIKNGIFFEGLGLKDNKTHVHCSCFALFDSVGDDVLRCGVVCLYWCRQLWVTHFDEDLLYHFRVF